MSRVFDCKTSTVCKTNVRLIDILLMKGRRAIRLAHSLHEPCWGILLGCSVRCYLNHQPMCSIAWPMDHIRVLLEEGHFDLIILIGGLSQLRWSGKTTTHTFGCKGVKFLVMNLNLIKIPHLGRIFHFGARECVQMVRVNARRGSAPNPPVSLKLISELFGFAAHLIIKEMLYQDANLALAHL
ncbi:hypothetical protein BCR37DRAFT_112399 [Protomyces lactucae-debilis]|uniref:Uncharacterized protein n=1 Tax=Protomyces lactucae-debilis TaxID=2754530 RepID=A0A1Y2F466_PROLT|nr:uncharacterized protein BCR37DRAFT_112399 [Protomyces lactucae-debilis]ORY78106.1 hypothetical protein BCR37DRAFT_112399 [Protomyces lactucae-debilis]